MHLKSPVRIAPIYRAEIWINTNPMHIISSHEVGEYLNPRLDGLPDFDADGFAYLANHAIAQLLRHAKVKGGFK